jgi:hypothetical protein
MGHAKRRPASGQDQRQHVPDRQQRAVCHPIGQHCRTQHRTCPVADHYDHPLVSKPSQKRRRHRGQVSGPADLDAATVIRWRCPPAQCKRRRHPGCLGRADTGQAQRQLVPGRTRELVEPPCRAMSCPASSMASHPPVPQPNSSASSSRSDSASAPCRSRRSRGRSLAGKSAIRIGATGISRSSLGLPARR